MNQRLISLRALVLVLTATSLAKAAPVTVEPAELTKRPDLVGREILVDDRVARFQIHPGRGFDEIWLKRVSMPFRLPPRLRFAQSPNAPAVRLQGILKREGDHWACDVTAIELMPKDLERLNQGIAVLSPGDFERRTTWANWAEKRGNDFDDKELIARGRALMEEAIRIEAERPALDPAKHWLELARRARSRQIPEPGPSALGHQAFRHRFAEIKTSRDLQSLRNDIDEILPKASDPVLAHNIDISRWEASYTQNPGAAYRSAPESARIGFDHRLWADVTQKWLEQRANDNPKEALALAEEAANQLPDRPAIAERLLELGIKDAAQGLGTMRLSEAQALAKLYRERLHQPERAQALLRDWLNGQRQHRLSPTDAEGRLALAKQYEELVGDRTTAMELLQSAWKIDPQSSELADAFRRRGYRKVKDEWVEIVQDSSAAKEGEASPRSSVKVSARQPLKGKTAQEVRTLLGKPNRKVYCASQGQLIEQWIYYSANQNQYVNFVRTGADLLPTVMSHTTLARPSLHTRP